jgi:hypothetical protein
MPEMSDRPTAPAVPAGRTDPADVLAGDDDGDRPITSGGRVDAGAATTGVPAGSTGEAPPGSIPGEDSAIDSDAV